MKSIVLFIVIFFVSCSNNKQKKNTVRIVGDVTIRGSFINDSIYEDTVKYYNLDDSLISERVFKDGKIEGLSFDYFPNGTIESTTNFKNGLKNGFHKVFDSSRSLYYSDFYYYDLNVDPVAYYKKDKSPNMFYFTNLQNETLLTIDYNNWGGIKNAYKNCINFVSNIEREDTVHKVDLLLYLINPPKFSFKYSIIRKKKKEKEDFEEVKQIVQNGDIPFGRKFLPALNDDENYCIGLNIYDSLLDKETIIYKDL